MWGCEDVDKYGNTAQVMALYSSRDDLIHGQASQKCTAYVSSAPSSWQQHNLRECASVKLASNSMHISLMPCTHKLASSAMTADYNI